MTKTEVENKSVSVALTKAAVGDEKTVTAIVTSPSMDRDYDQVDTKTLRLPLKGGGTVQAGSLTGNEDLDVPFLINHAMDVTDVIGSARSASMTSDGELQMVFGLSTLAKAQDMYTLLNEGHLDNAFSITFHDYDLQNGVMYDAEVLEVSLVWRGSNPDARLLAVSKSLKAETKELDVSEEDTETEVVKPETVETKDNKEPEVVNEVDDTTVETEDKKENKMTKEELAAENVVEQKEVVVEQPKKKAVVSKTILRKNFISQLEAVRSQNSELASKFAREGAELDGLDTKSLDLSGVYLSSVVSADIKAAYLDVGGVASLVTNEDILGAQIYKSLVEVAGVGFQAVSLGGTKQEDAPVWSPVNIQPYEYALIVRWLDSAAQQTPVNVYNAVVRYIAKEYKKLQDQVILVQRAATVDTENRPATGLVPLLEAASRSSAFTDYTAPNLIPALGTAFGAIQSDGTITLVMNKVTWAKMATSSDTQGHPIFNQVGTQVTVGALGTFNVVTSSVMPNDVIVAGVMSDYTLVTRGDLGTLFSQEATVGGVSLFTTDQSALRAAVNIAGAATPITSFYMLDKSGFVS